MSKKLRRILSLALVLCCLLSCIPSAFAEHSYSVKRAKSAKVYIITCGDKLFGRTTKVTIQNTSKRDAYNVGSIIIHISSKDCKSIGSSIIRIAPGQTKTFNIKTSLGHAGDTVLKIESEDAGIMSCTVKVNDNSVIGREP